MSDTTEQKQEEERELLVPNRKKDPQAQPQDPQRDRPTVAPRGTVAGGVAGEHEQKDPHTDPDNPTVAPRGTVAGGVAGEPDNPTAAPRGGTVAGGVAGEP